MQEKPFTKGATFTRESEVEIVVRAAEGDRPEEKTVRLSVSSEEPYLKWCWDDEAKDYVQAYEVLGHGPDEIDFSRMKSGLVIQDGHFGKQIGIMDAPEVKDGKLCGDVRFGHSREAQDAKADALDGIRRNMSVGYFVDEYRRDGERDGYPVFRAVRWTPFEGSFVNVPADPTVGVGRSRENNDGALPSITQTPKEKKSMKEDEVKAVVDAAVKSATDATNAKIDGLAVQLKELAERKPETPAPAAVKQFDETTTSEISKNYSLLKAIRALAGEKVDCGYERELSDEIARQTKREARGLFIPEAAFRDVLTGKTNVADHIVGNGGATVETELLSSQMIDALVAKTVLGEAGVQTLAGLVGDVAIPKGGSVSAAWISAEDGAAANTNPVFSQITATPHTIAANTDISRKLMLQSSISVQSKITGWILDAIARGIETAAFAGTGENGQPTGVESTSGITTLALTADAPTHGELVDAWKQMYTDNVDGAFKWIGSPAVKALLCKTRDALFFNNTGAKASSAVVGGLNGDYLCTKDGLVEGYPFIISNLCSAKKLYFADWSQLMLAFWSGVDLTVDPYSLSTKGALRLVAFQDCDVIVRQPKAFQVGTALS